MLVFCGVRQDFQITPTETFNITSPWYPRQYPLYKDCVWTIRLASSALSGNINVDFLDLNTGTNHDKLYFASLSTTILYDVDIFNLGDDIYRFTGRYFPRSVVVTSFSEMQIAWDASVWTAGGRGFALMLSWAPSNNGEFVLYHVFTLLHCNIVITISKIDPTDV